MKIVQINICDYGSTGRIMELTAQLARNDGDCVYTFSRKWLGTKNKDDGHIYFGSVAENVLHHVLGPVTGCNECFSVGGTLWLIAKLKKIGPDIVHLHNLHGWYLNLPLLFGYLKKQKIKVIWTLHDCWSFTGHCPYFDTSQCDRWKNGCRNCPSYRQYPQTLWDGSKFMWRWKRKWFTGVQNMTLVTPSEWLAGLVKQSFLQEYPVKVIHNGIDLTVFRRMDSNLKQRHGWQKKYIVLGVAQEWERRKGLDVFCRLARRLDAQKYQILLVGTNDEVDKALPGNIISIHRTKNQEQLAQIYAGADVFVNPTREDNFPTVNLEALACGTPVVTFRTGGSPEMLNSSCGAVVEKDDMEALEQEIIRICQTRPYRREACAKRAADFDKQVKFQEYLQLYRSVL